MRSRARHRLTCLFLAPHTHTALARTLRPLVAVLRARYPPTPTAFYPCPFCHQAVTPTARHAFRYSATAVACDPPVPGQALVVTPTHHVHPVVH